MITKKLVVLSGAGMSAESGISTFRDANGLWENHDIMEVASPQGWRDNPALVLEFYNQRRRQLLQVKPNTGHTTLVEMEKYFDVSIITQNVDDLHERAGSSDVLHLHGELFKVRSTGNPSLVYEWKKDLNIGDKCAEGHQLRPHIVWFGESVPMIMEAAQIIKRADIVIIIGTSMQVYPAAGLVRYATNATNIYYIDPHPALHDTRGIEVIAEKAGVGVPLLFQKLKRQLDSAF